MSTIKIRNNKEGQSFHFKADPLNPKFNHLPIVEQYLEKETIFNEANYLSLEKRALIAKTKMYFN